MGVDLGMELDRLIAGEDTTDPGDLPHHSNVLVEELSRTHGPLFLS